MINGNWSLASVWVRGMVGNVQTEEHMSRLKGAAAPQLHSVAVKNQGSKLSILHIFHENPGIFCYCLNVKHSILKSGATKKKKKAGQLIFFKVLTKQNPSWKWPLSCQISNLGWRENQRLGKQFTLNFDGFLRPALLSSYCCCKLF